MKEIGIKEALENENALFIDVRSPSEYNEAHLPGAINVPLFTDEERSHVGTTYKAEGQEPATWLGMKLVSPKIPELMENIKQEIQAGKIPIVYCWRGGMRSKSVCTFAELSGLDVSRLTGGFRSYRQWVVENLTPDMLPKQFIVLHGMTGVGKTTLLDKLKEKGFPILDLEKCAGHRGSVFGGIGKEVHNQKTFESILLHDLQKISGLPYAFMEAESRRVGKAIQPDFLLEAKKKGIHIVCETSVDIRAERIYEEYVSDNLGVDFKSTVLEAIAPILKRFVPKTKDILLDCIEKEDYKTLIKILLIDYYDPRYQHKLEEYEGEFYTVCVDDLDMAVDELIKIALKKKVILS